MGRSTIRGIFLVCAALFLTSPDTFAQKQAVPKSHYEPRTERGRLVSAIVLRWSAYVHKTYGTPPQRWAESMSGTFARSPLVNLRRGAAMKDYSAMIAAISEVFPRDAVLAGTPAKGQSVVKEVKQAPTKDLLYTMFPWPCRLADTRSVARRLSAGEVRTFSAGTSAIAQGGDPRFSCRYETGVISAIVVNITAVHPSDAGYLTAFPAQWGQPLASVLNYRAGDVIGNEVVVRVTPGSSFETAIAEDSRFSVYSYAATDLVIDVVGYFAPPATDPLDCVQRGSGDIWIASGMLGEARSEVCPTGYTATGGGCDTGARYATEDGLSIYSFGPQADGSYACKAQNRRSEARLLNAQVVCCRLPKN